MNRMHSWVYAYESDGHSHYSCLECGERVSVADDRTITLPGYSCEGNTDPEAPVNQPRDLSGGHAAAPRTADDRAEEAAKYLEQVIGRYPGSVGPGARDDLIKVVQILRAQNTMDAPEPAQRQRIDDTDRRLKSVRADLASAAEVGRSRERRVDGIEDRVAVLERAKPPNENQYVNLAARLAAIEAWAGMAPRKAGE